jgi:hypothetical protein
LCTETVDNFVGKQLRKMPNTLFGNHFSYTAQFLYCKNI